MNKLPNPINCGQPATWQVEGYTPANGLSYGRLDLRVALCEAHLDRTYREIREAGFTPHSMPAVGEHRCGTGFDYQAQTALGEAEIPADVAEILARLTPEQAQAILDEDERAQAWYAEQAATPIKTLPCPTWCAVDHTDPEKLWMETTVSRVREHTRSFLRIERPGKKTLHVEVIVCDDLDEGTRTDPTEVWIFGAEDGLSPAHAELLAEALPRATEVIDG